jgi:hypothetical protein
MEERLRRLVGKRGTLHICVKDEGFSVNQYGCEGKRFATVGEAIADCENGRLTAAAASAQKAREELDDRLAYQRELEAEFSS